MIARLERLRRHPGVFRHLTGLTPAAFLGLPADVPPACHEAERARLGRPGRRRRAAGGGRRAAGAGQPSAPAPDDQGLPTVVSRGCGTTRRRIRRRRRLAPARAGGGPAAQAPRRKPRGRPRPPADRRYNRAFARRRVRVEHTIGRMRCCRALRRAGRRAGRHHRRRPHAERVRAVAGLVNRMIGHGRAD